MADGTPIALRVDSVIPLQAAQGMCGDKLNVDISLFASDGVVRQIALFVKKFAWKGKSEAVHYRHLARFEVPTPCLYGAILHSDGDEILFLERLQEIGFDKFSETEWREMLSLLARLNACPVTREYASVLHPFEQGGKVGKWWITGLGSFPSDEEIKANLSTCGVEGEELTALCGAAQGLYERVAALPRGLLHQDFLPDNFGWRVARETMVIFDLHKHALGPRFADVGPYLGLPDWSDTAAFLDQEPGRREALTRHYLAEYARFGGETVSLKMFREEVSLLFWAHKVAVLWWLAEQKDEARIAAVLNYLRRFNALLTGSLFAVREEG